MRAFAGKTAPRQGTQGMSLQGGCLDNTFNFGCQASVNGAAHRRQNRTQKDGRTNRIVWMKQISRRKGMAMLEHRLEHGNSKGVTETKLGGVK